MELREKEDSQEYDQPELTEEMENTEKRLYNDYHGPSTIENNHLGVNNTQSKASAFSLNYVYVMLFILSCQFWQLLIKHCE